MPVVCARHCGCIMENAEGKTEARKGNETEPQQRHMRWGAKNWRHDCAVYPKRVKKKDHKAFLPIKTKYQTLKKRHTSHHTENLTILCKRTPPVSKQAPKESWRHISVRVQTSGHEYLPHRVKTGCRSSKRRGRCQY